MFIWHVCLNLSDDTNSTTETSLTQFLTFNEAIKKQIKHNQICKNYAIQQPNTSQYNLLLNQIGRRNCLRQITPAADKRLGIDSKRERNKLINAQNALKKR